MLDDIGLKFDGNGLIPAVVQDDENGDVLMVAYMNAEAVKLTLETGKATFYSRSRDKMWIKGEESGHTQIVKSVCTDCDKDTLVVRVKQTGGACHHGYRSCFYREIDADGNMTVIAEKVFDPDEVYKKSE